MAWSLRAINPDSVHFAAAAAFAYGVPRLFETCGLWRVNAWASPLGCAVAPRYVPFEGRALVRQPGWPATSVVAIKLVVVPVLARDLLGDGTDRAPGPNAPGGTPGRRAIRRPGAQAGTRACARWTSRSPVPARS